MDTTRQHRGGRLPRRLLPSAASTTMLWTILSPERTTPMDFSLAAVLLFIAVVGAVFAFALWTRKLTGQQLQSDQALGLLRSLYRDRWGRLRFLIRRVRGRARRR